MLADDLRNKVSNRQQTEGDVHGATQERKLTRTTAAGNRSQPPKHKTTSTDIKRASDVHAPLKERVKQQRTGNGNGYTR